MTPSLEHNDRMMATERLLFRRWREDDEKILGAILGDAAVMAFSDRGAVTAKDQQIWLRRMIADEERAGLPFCFALERQDEGDVIGYLRLSQDLTRVRRREVEIGFRLKRSAWGFGYATEAARAGIGAARRVPKVDKVVAIVDPRNRPSLNVLRKSGMTYHRDVMLAGYDYPDRLYAVDLTGRLP